MSEDINMPVKDAINKRALFADETEDYRVPEEPAPGDRLLLRFRTARGDADLVSFVRIDADGKDKRTEAGQAMRKTAFDPLFDYYEYELVVGDTRLLYFFRVEKGDETCVYSRLGPCTEEEALAYPFSVTPGFSTPAWAKGAVMYQIFVDRFCCGDPSTDVCTNEYVYLGYPVTHAKTWDRLPSEFDVGCFYGGDLSGVEKKLDYLKYLGIEVIYFNPLFVSPSNHKYDTQDYDHIDPHYTTIKHDRGGLVRDRSKTNRMAWRYVRRTTDPKNLQASDEFFADFMQKVHSRGMRVIIDGVFNHCGSFNKWLDREKIYMRQGSYSPGAALAKESPYNSFFRFEKDAWPDNYSYESWWNNETLPKLNYEGSPELCEYILKIAEKWVSPPYSVDGWRLDVAADLGHSAEFNHSFWKAFRKRVKAANPDAIILAEHYGSPKSWLAGDEWDGVMNYDAFMEPVTWFLTGMEKHSDRYDESRLGDGHMFFETMKYNTCHMQAPSVQVAMNQLSNHDHSRFLTRTNRTVGRLASMGSAAAEQKVDKAIYRAAVVVQFSWPGAPTLYYGDEAGVCGWTDPDSRRPYPWGREDIELVEFHKYAIALRKRLPALRRGSVKFLAEGSNLIAFGRMSGRNKCVIAVNISEQERTEDIPVWEIGVEDKEVLRRVLLTNASGYDVGRVDYTAQDGHVRLLLGPKTAMVLCSGAYGLLY